jgi:hypothetical protein
MRQRRKPRTEDLDEAWRAVFGQPSRHELEEMAAQLRKLGFLAWLEPAPPGWGEEPGTLALYLPGAVAFSAYGVEAIVEWFLNGGGRQPQPIEPPLHPTIEEREAALVLLVWLSQGHPVPEA